MSPKYHRPPEIENERSVAEEQYRKKSVRINLSDEDKARLGGIVSGAIGGSLLSSYGYNTALWTKFLWDPVPNYFAAFVYGMGGAVLGFAVAGGLAYFSLKSLLKRIVIE